MAGNYYYLVAGLPDLVQDAKKQPIALQEFKNELLEQLSARDIQLSKMLFLQFDNQNLLNQLLKTEKPHHPLANFTADELEQNIKEPLALLPYMNQFITAFKAETPLYENLSWEDNLTSLYFEYLKKTTNPFLKKWFNLDFQLRNFRVAMNARDYKLNPSSYILGDDEVSVAFKKSTLRDFGLGNDYPLINKVATILENENVLQQELDLDRIRWEYLDELNTFNYFSIEVVLAFIIKVMIIERWIALDPEAGHQIFNKLIKDLQKNYEFPKEFSIYERRKETN
ncbi:MAG: DUF2764 family protein [Salinivirgaceae bacterium]|nr:DUF2764 family protein [Salinivirgaceae bacterium]MDY0280304.1 DUF2764 family protein [Salinivirgaceae bacterium]